jgi:hypothetical protein
MATGVGMINLAFIRRSISSSANFIWWWEFVSGFFNSTVYRTPFCSKAFKLSTILLLYLSLGFRLSLLPFYASISACSAALMVSLHLAFSNSLLARAASPASLATLNLWTSSIFYRLSSVEPGSRTFSIQIFEPI